MMSSILGVEEGHTLQEIQVHVELPHDLLQLVEAAAASSRSLKKFQVHVTDYRTSSRLRASLSLARE